MSSTNVLLLMQLLPEPGRTDRSRAAELTPCDKAALFYASRLVKEDPSLHLTAALITDPSFCPDDQAVPILKKAFALGAGRGILLRYPTGVSCSVPAPGRSLLSAIRQYTGIDFPVILTGFHRMPAITDADAAQNGYSWYGNITDMTLVPGSAETARRTPYHGPECAELQFKKGTQLFCNKKPLPLLAEIVRSETPPIQPAFQEIIRADQMSVEILDPEGFSSGHTACAEQIRFPLFYHTKKTAPAQIASELLSILKKYRLIPRDAAGQSEGQLPPHRCFCSETSSGFRANPLTWADRIVSVGRGAVRTSVPTDQVLSMAEQLASLLDASVGSSKAAVDLGIMPPSRQIGKTSCLVSPDLYIACGISGSVQHLDGMRQSGFIVAINEDLSAPVFRIADIGICGDIAEMLEALTAALKKAAV